MLRKLIGPLMLSGIVATVFAASPARGAEPTGQAMRMYRDPETGAIGPPPRGEQAPPAASARRTLSSGVGELSEEPVEAPAGGVKVNLRGRFRAAVRRDAGAGNGALHRCVEQRGPTDE